VTGTRARGPPASENGTARSVAADAHAGAGHHLLRRRGFAALHGGSANGGRLRPRAVGSWRQARANERPDRLADRPW